MAGAGDIETLEAELAGHGLCLRGWVFPDAETAPRLSTGGAAAAVGLIGHLGGDFWPIFETWHHQHSGVENPFDSWSKAVITPLALSAGGEAVFPSDKPWQPFQQWARAAEGLKGSPLGMLIHPVYGLWHGYRGAILFGPEALAQLGLSAAANEAGSAVGATIHPCDTCVDKPCLSACPVDAFSPNGFDVASCRAYLKTDPGRKGCMSTGCLARDACPVGRAHRYDGAQIRFHMTAYS
ncbi:MAG: ferredoxin [Hoeflea sp.]|uniref:ferredoxin n=1 Tax=Hoeflea sp. TaxID=1940281 RepID=UPI001D200551|nr:ferredoxin [Hoeflea sp.]MBU4531054.1 ferredoxin [Alphaproteobacteria bacterium]MBU4542829.1 ferredoxin [Alphaproteobacteria bacterium]MBU4552641.1 ferredoxin [Alphaproteobacteria bacterium]MBV1722946.1 ferredoxin [Hoeflea sp.]MBV1762857.1 ferredoxin [Hoeflea sp.]